jgi:hypothetical protein
MQWAFTGFDPILQILAWILLYDFIKELICEI